MQKVKIIRVFISVSDDLGDVRTAVQDLLVQLNRHFQPRCVEFVPTLPAEGPTDGDLALALYWKDFGDLPKADFEKAYESFRATTAPRIYVFFKEPDEGITEALKAFRDSFAEKYGHFYCRFEFVDSVKFQLAVQGLSLLPGDAKETLKVEGGEVRLGEDPVAKVENLPFAKLNAKRQSLQRQITDVEIELEELEKRVAVEPEDEDLQDSLRTIRVKRHDLNEELAQYDGFLCETAVFFAKESAKELDERVYQARELFNRGQVRDANLLLDLPEMVERDRRDSELFAKAREARIRNIQAFTAKAKLVMTDASMEMRRRVDVAGVAYEHAIRVAKDIRLGVKELVRIMFGYARMLSDSKRFPSSIALYSEALELMRNSAALHPEENGEDVAHALNELAALHQLTHEIKKAEAEYVEALDIQRKLAEENPGIHRPNVAVLLCNLASLHSDRGLLEQAEAEYREALLIRLELVGQPGMPSGALPHALNSLAALHIKMKQWSEAEKEYGIALAVRRKLAEENEEAYAPGLAHTLNGVATLHGMMGRLDESESDYTEALAIRRKMAAMHPEAYEADLAETLNNLANLHQTMHLLPKAESEYAEAIRIFRRLASEHPKAYEAVLGSLLHNLSVLHRNTKCFKKAEEEGQEALAIRRKLAETLPDVHGTEVAMTLNNLANLHKDMQCPEMAEKEFKASLVILRKAVLANPGIHESDLAMTLGNIGNLHREMEQFTEATAEYDEALGIYRQLADKHPRAYGKEVAKMLLCLAVLHATSGATMEAEEKAEEAKAWCASHPDGTSPYLNAANELIQSMRRTANGRKDTGTMSEEPIAAVRKYLSARGMHYECREENQYLFTAFRLHCKLKMVRLVFRFRNEGCSCYGMSPVHVAPEKLGEVLRYSAMVNYGLLQGNFDVNVRDGEVRFKTWIQTKGTERLSDAVIEDCLGLVNGVFERFGDGFAALAMGESDAETEFKKSGGKLD